MTGQSKLIRYSCPKCQTVNTPRGKALTVALTCSKCGIYFCPSTNVNDKFKSEYPSVITIGSRPTIEGKSYEVLGYTLKKERKYKYRWTEYFLFSPYHGVAFLSQSDGNWNFLTPYANHPLSVSAADNDDPEVDGTTFRLYSKYQAEVLFAKGEFFHDVIGVTESSYHMEHIAPPHVLVHEKNKSMVSSYMGKYMRPGDVATAFGIPKDKLPAKSGMGYTEPILGNFTPSALVALTVFSIIVAFLIASFFNMNAAEENIVQKSYSQDELKDSVKMFSTPSFELKNVKNLVLNVTAPVENDWFFAEYSLINENTDEEYVFTKEIEYYYGRTDGENWSEGSRTVEVYLSSVPPGKYHFDIYPEFSSTRLFRITIFRDATFLGNFWTIAFGLCVFPVLYFTYRYFKEVARWSDSDYSPYDSE